MIKIVLIGVGHVTQRGHLPALKVLKNFQIVGFHDTNKNIISKFRKLIPYYKNSEELLNIKPDIALIATPSYLHCKICNEVLSRNINVLTEKPLALKLKEAYSIKSFLDKSNAKLFVGLQFRHARQVKKLKKVIENKCLGEVVAFQSLFTNHISRRNTITGYETKRKLGGGALFDLAYHHIDLFAYLFGEKITSIKSTILSKINEDDTAFLEFKFNNVLGSSFFSSATFNEHTLKVFFENGIVLIDFFKSPDIFVLANKNTVKNKMFSELKYSFSSLKIAENIIASKRVSPFISQLEAIENELNGMKTNQASYEDGLNALKVVLAAYKSNLVEGRLVNL